MKRRPSAMLSKYLIGGSLILSGVLAIALGIAVNGWQSAKEVIRDLEGWQGGMVQATRLASGNSEVTKDTAQAQVQALGTNLITLHNALKLSNDAVDKLAEDRRRAEEVAAREAEARAAAIVTAEKLRDELRGRYNAPVPEERMEEEIRRAQDASYEAGL